MIGILNLEPLNIRRTNRRLTIFHKTNNGPLDPLNIISKFCVALDISIAEHTITSTPEKTVTNIISSQDNNRLDFTTRQTIPYQRTK